MTSLVRNTLVALTFFVPGVCYAQFFPPHATVLGKSTEEWATDLWQWKWNYNASVVNLEGYFSGELLRSRNDGPVFFLPWGETPPQVDVPAGKPLLFTFEDNSYGRTPEEVDADGIPTWFSGNPADGIREPDAAFMREFVTSLADSVEWMQIELDGTVLTDAEIRGYREAATFSLDIFDPENISGSPIGTWPESVFDGHFVMLEPLTPGEHQLNFEYEFSGVGISPRLAETITLRAVPEPASFLLAVTAMCGAGLLRKRQRPATIGP